MQCNICGSEITLRKKYGEHVSDLSVKTLIKKLLPYFDFIIPKSITKLKRHSSRQTLFTGYINICSNCGHGEMENPPTTNDLQKYYQDEYWSQRSTTVETAVNNDTDYIKNPRAIHQTDFVMKEIHCSSIINVLEIGAGTAYASLLLRDKCQNSEMHLHACEPGQQWEDYYQRQGIRKVANYFPFETDERFDYVHTSHWLEHTLNLDETLSKLRDIINPSGYLFIEVPNTEHFYWDLPMGDTPHIHFFTAKSLVKALENHDFNCVNVGEYGITYLERKNGVSLTADRYGACEKGFWIRGLFKKTG